MNVVWRKSSRSGTNGGSCVEVATLPDRILVRDSKDPGGPVLTFTLPEWRAFLGGADDHSGVKGGEFDA
ncbi:MAG: DUF397 domain-containing protein [Micromonosporaceae bacterium]